MPTFSKASTSVRDKREAAGYRGHDRAEDQLGRGIALDWRSECRQHGHADAQPERGGDGCRRHPDADAQRWRHRDLYRRLGQQCADLQLYGGGRPEHVGAGCDGVNLNGATIKDGSGNAANLAG